MFQKIYNMWTPNVVSRSNIIDYCEIGGESQLFNNLREWLNATKNPYIKRVGTEELLQRYASYPEKTHVLKHLMDSATKDARTEQSLFSAVQGAVQGVVQGVVFIHDGCRGKFVHGGGVHGGDIRCNNYVYSVDQLTLVPTASTASTAESIADHVARQHETAQLHYFIQNYSNTPINVICTADRKICPLFVARQNAKYANKKDNINIYYTAFPSCTVTNYNPFGSTFCNANLDSNLTSGVEVLDTDHGVFLTMYKSLQFLRRRRHFTRLAENYRKKLVAEVHKHPDTLWKLAIKKWRTEMQQTPLLPYVSREQTISDWKKWKE